MSLERWAPFRHDTMLLLPLRPLRLFRWTRFHSAPSMLGLRVPQLLRICHPRASKPSMSGSELLLIEARGTPCHIPRETLSQPPRITRRFLWSVFHHPPSLEARFLRFLLHHDLALPFLALTLPLRSEPAALSPFALTRSNLARLSLPIRPLSRLSLRGPALYRPRAGPHSPQAPCHTLHTSHIPPSSQSLPAWSPRMIASA